MSNKSNNYLKIFESNPSASCDNSDDDQCEALKRIFIGLKYYDALFSDSTKTIEMTQEEKRDIFLHFNNTVYKKQLLEDYIHFTETHTDSKQLLQMQNELKIGYNITKCNISKCMKLRRHYRERGMGKNSKHKPNNNNNNKNSDNNKP
eukprot:281039_1